MNESQEIEVKNDKESKYHFLISEETGERASAYLLALQINKKIAGSKLEAVRNMAPWNGQAWSAFSLQDFIACLINSKELQIFAESAQYKQENAWNDDEVALLGDISCLINAKAYDHGTWTNPTIHNEPIDVDLIYVPGALLNTQTMEFPDYQEIYPIGKFNFSRYYDLYERRLLPGLLAINQQANNDGKKRFITMPGIGCGVFKNQKMSTQDIHQNFYKMLERLIGNHLGELNNIAGIWCGQFDYKEAKSVRSRQEDESRIDIIYEKSTTHIDHLSPPKQHSEEYKDCRLVSFVAWDHLSYPGNDYWGGDRYTDDGVKAAATNTMEILTGLEGEYDNKKFKFCPQDSKKTWKAVCNATFSDTADKPLLHGQFTVYENKNPFSKALKSIENLLHSEDWAVTKRNTVFASKPTSVRKMIALVESGKINLKPEQILENLKVFLNQRQKEWHPITNTSAAVFYTALQNILGDEQQYEKLNDLTVLKK